MNASDHSGHGHATAMNTTAPPWFWAHARGPVRTRCAAVVRDPRERLHREASRRRTATNAPKSESGRAPVVAAIPPAAGSATTEPAASSETPPAPPREAQRDRRRQPRRDPAPQAEDRRRSGRTPGRAETARQFQLRCAAPRADARARAHAHGSTRREREWKREGLRAGTRRAREARPCRAISTPCRRRPPVRHQPRKSNRR